MNNMERMVVVVMVMRWELTAARVGDGFSLCVSLMSALLLRF